MGRLPYQGFRVIERSKTLAGRLVGLLFADQGAEVFIGPGGACAPGPANAYLDRGKIELPASALERTASADLLIVDGDEPVERAPSQILLRITAAIPGDAIYGDLAADCSEDLLNALVGFFTDMSTTGPLLGRPVIYTPLPLCSVYAGVNGAIAAGAALVDRERCGLGREIVASRIAGGLSAIGALTLTSTGIPEHLAPTKVGGVPEGVAPQEFKAMIESARHDPARQLWLEQRLAPLAGCYRAADQRMILPMAAPNRRLTRRILQHLDLWDWALSAGFVDRFPYDTASVAYSGRNLADSMALSFTMTSRLADQLEAAFAKKTAAEWESELCAIGIPAVKVLTWEEWQNDAASRQARIFAEVDGCPGIQIGRSVWLASAQPYPALVARRRASELPEKSTPPRSDAKKTLSKLPLAGYTVVDLANVVAGPSAGRMFVELGATVVSILPLYPEHSPTITVTWAGELAAGKRSIIVDPNKADGHEVIQRIVAGADLVLANMQDAQLARLHLDPIALRSLNPSAIGLQLTAQRGERHGVRHDFPGYDPAIQGTTGIMTRFGPEGCPTFHGVASCVDYLCGYLGVWAGVCALAARERRQNRRGDWAETSLACAATLVQCLQMGAEESVRGPYATGKTAGERVYQLLDGWIFVQGQVDLSTELSQKTVQQALRDLSARGIPAVPVQSCRDLAKRHSDTSSRTIRFEKRERDGWVTECFAPTWFAFDREPAPRPSAPSRVGSDGPAVLAEVGYTKEEIEKLIRNGAVGRTEWEQNTL